MFKRKFVFLSSMKEKEQIQNHLPQRNFLGENYQFAFGIFYSTSPLSSFTDNNCIWNTDNICLYNTDYCCICKNDKGRGKKKLGKSGQADRLDWNPPQAVRKMWFFFTFTFNFRFWLHKIQNKFYPQKNIFLPLTPPAPPPTHPKAISRHSMISTVLGRLKGH